MASHVFHTDDPVCGPTVHAYTITVAAGLFTVGPVLVDSTVICGKKDELFLYHTFGNGETGSTLPTVTTV